MFFSKLLVLLSLSLIATLALADTVDFTQCLATIANKKAPAVVTDLQCSYCAEGINTWPCNAPELCVCVTNGPIPPLFPWQQRRDEVLTNLTSQLLFPSPSGDIQGSKATICGLLGNIAVNTDYTFDYTYKVNQSLGLFMFSPYIQDIYNDLLRNYYAGVDSLWMQVHIIMLVLWKFDWSSIHRKFLVDMATQILLSDLMTNTSYNAEDQAENFMKHFPVTINQTLLPRQLSARHCYFVLASPPGGDFTQCQATVAIKKVQIPVSDLQCSYCAEGYPLWPCNAINFCECVSIPTPNVFQWQFNRAEVLNQLINQTNFTTDKGELVNFTKAGICGVLGNIGAATNYTYDYKNRDPDKNYGLFQFATSLEDHLNSYISKHLNSSDSASNQVNFFVNQINPYFNWTAIDDYRDIKNGIDVKLFDKLINTQYTAIQQAQYFIDLFPIHSTVKPEQRIAATKHCDFLYPYILPPTTTTTQFTITLNPPGNISQQNKISVIIGSLLFIFIYLIF